MKHIIQISLLFAVLFSSTQLMGQNLLNKANKQYELKAYSSAIPNYLRVLSADRDQPQVISRLADCYRHINEIESALMWYEKGAPYAGTEPEHFLNYGKMLMTARKYEEAKKWFKVYSETDKYTGEHFMKSCDYAVSLEGKPATFRAYKEFVNTVSSDFGPAFYGDYIVYSSSRTDIKRKLKRNEPKGLMDSPNNQLYISSMDNKGYLRIPTLLQSDLANNYNEGPVSFSDNGEWVVFTKNNFENGVRMISSSGGDMSLYIAEVNAQGVWDNIKAMPFNISGYSNAYPYISSSGKKIYFASNRPGGFGGWDIYVSFRTGEGRGWSTPQNLGPIVNSPGNEITPYVDGGNLYFSSDFHHGLGGMDIFRATQTESKWNNLFHTGNILNSPYDDHGFIFNSEDNRGYFISNRKGTQGHEDIYKVRKTTDNFVITVTNESDSRPVEGASIDFSACGEPTFETNINGQYEFEALAGMNCEIQISAPGYKAYTLNVSSFGERLTRQYNVQLRRKGEEYLGKIVDSESNDAIAGVVIKATDPSNGHTLSTTSNLRGEYTLALRAPKKYIVSYSKAGFVNTKKQVRVTSQTDKSILGILSFKKSYNLSDAGVAVESNPDVKVTKVEREIESPSSENEVTIYSEGAEGLPIPVSDNPDGEFEDVLAKEGFAVQVAAYFDEREINVRKYESLQELGNVYKTKDGKAQKIRVGVYPTRRDAELAKKVIARKGYNQAFVVAEVADRAKGGLRLEEEKEEAPKAIQSVEVPKQDYKIRVATFRSTKHFDPAMIEGFGKIEKRKAGKYTIVLLSGFDSLEEAIVTKKKINEMGYDDAHLVTEEGKQLKKVK